MKKCAIFPAENIVFIADYICTHVISSFFDQSFFYFCGVVSWESDGPLTIVKKLCNATLIYKPFGRYFPNIHKQAITPHADCGQVKFVGRANNGSLVGHAVCKLLHLVSWLAYRIGRL